MTYFLLAWLEEGLVSADLTNGYKLILAHSDPDLAQAYANATIHRHAPDGRIATIRMDSSREEVAQFVATAAGIADPNDVGDLRLVFSDDPMYLHVLNQMLGD